MITPFSIKYRPGNLSNVVGQEVVVQTLTNSFKNDSWHHAYILEGNLGCGKCITGDSIVVTNKGLRRIKSLIKKKKNKNFYKMPKSFRVFGETGFGKAEYGYYEEQAKTKRVVTTMGYEIEGTYEHPLKILNKLGDLEWKKIGDIKAGDVLVIDRTEHDFDYKSEKISFEFNKQKYVKKMFNNIGSQKNSMKSLLDYKYDAHYGFVDRGGARFFGYLMAEGCIDDDKVSITNNNDFIKNDIKKTLKNTFNVPFKEIEDKRKKNLVNIQIQRKGFINFINNLDLNHKSKDKFLPDFILSFPYDLMKEFLSAYFSSDGGMDGPDRVSAYSASKKLILDIQSVLLTFGIISSVKQKKTKCSNCKDKNKIHISYVLSITGENARIFNKKIGFLIDKKQKKLEKLCNKRTNTNNDIIPYLQDILCNFKKTLPINKGGF